MRLSFLLVLLLVVCLVAMPMEVAAADNNPLSKILTKLGNLFNKIFKRGAKEVKAAGEAVVEKVEEVVDKIEEAVDGLGGDGGAEEAKEL